MKVRKDSLTASKLTARGYTALPCDVPDLVEFNAPSHVFGEAMKEAINDHAAEELTADELLGWLDAVVASGTEISIESWSTGPKTRFVIKPAGSETLHVAAETVTGALRKAVAALMPLI